MVTSEDILVAQENNLFSDILLVIQANVCKSCKKNPSQKILLIID